jgi:tetratricopeptide (TPR) repeat protein
MQLIAVEAARRVGSRGPLALAHRLAAEAFSTLGSFQETRDHLDRALDLYGQLGDRIAAARVQIDLAILSHRQGCNEQALAHAQRGLDLYRAANAAPVKVALGLNMVGWCLGHLGRHSEAVEICERALAITPEKSLYSRANIWDSLGYAHHHLGDHERATACYRQALTTFRDIGDRHSEALALDHLGDTEHATGDTAAAHETWRRAVDILTGLGHPEAESIAAKLDPQWTEPSRVR